MSQICAQPWDANPRRPPPVKAVLTAVPPADPISEPGLTRARAQRSYLNEPPSSRVVAFLVLLYSEHVVRGHNEAAGGRRVRGRSVTIPQQTISALLHVLVLISEMVGNFATLLLVNT
ncbi:uncharacterized protein LOC114246765 [Bombyx mandarina]|uniref:Uncharacterized protein LOC114246765 n=1 Tax=Bombyx mandarina TaxID=7092 RepID=A0A6J2K054_BOMMA|nr:uncharacterized protein LOC114246765 [Bombyx mandarina]